MSRNWSELVYVYNDTLKLTSGLKVVQSVRYQGLFKDYNPQKLYDETIVDVVNMDTFDATFQLIHTGLRPVLLNMASNYNPGGGVHRGCMAQEEELFRRSNYYHTYNKNIIRPHEDGSVLYPDEVVYTPELVVVKDTKYNVIKSWLTSAIACAAIRNPKVKVDGTYNSQDRYVMKCKIEMILQTAYHHKHDSIVLGAFGCGAYHNPPNDVAKLFEDALTKWDGRFRRIRFAVLSKGRNDNFDIFNKMLTK